MTPSNSLLNGINLEAADRTASKQNMQEWQLTAPSMLVV